MGMDVSEYLLRNRLHLYKTKTTSGDVNGTTVRRRNIISNRKNTRNALTFSNRNIPDNLSPIVTNEKKTNSMDDKLSARLEMLKNWKLQKQIKKDMEKKNQKPLFKVYHVPVNIGLIDLSKVNTEIKGKPIIKNKTSKFAPENHVFTAPVNVKNVSSTKTPSKISNGYSFKDDRQTKQAISNKGSSVKSLKKMNLVDINKSDKITKKTVGNKLPSHKKNIKCNSPNSELNAPRERVTKSVNSKAITPKKKLSFCSSKNKNCVDTVDQDLVLNISKKSTEIISEKTGDEKINLADCSVSHNVEDILLTPIHASKETDTNPSSAYISPFVTVSRGKNSARKEYKFRNSISTNIDSPNKAINLKYTSPKASADYFTRKLNTEIIRIQEICQQWEDFKLNSNIPEEAEDMINVCIGQSTLLITKKFQQFQGLIEKCRNCTDEEKPITCKDLHGFWDMLYIQVEDLEKRFNNLNEMKNNNWQEIIPEKKLIPMKKKRVAKPKLKTKESNLKNIINAARQNKNKLTKIDTLDEPSEPNSCTPLRTSNGNKHLRALTINNTNSRLSSPGLTMMKVSQAIKNGDGVTPGKSILITDNNKSSKRIAKSVLFKENYIETKDENEHYPQVTPRRSERIRKISFC